MNSDNDMFTHLRLDWLNTGLDYVQAIVARLSGLLLMIGLVAAMANLLTNGGVLDASPVLQQVWAWLQAIAVDSNLWLMCVRSVQAVQSKQRFKAGVYIGASILLLFVAVEVTALESLKQALGISLSTASTYTYVPIYALTIVRSLVVVALVFISGLEVMNRPGVHRGHVNSVQIVDAVNSEQVSTSPALPEHVQSMDSKQASVNASPVDSKQDDKHTGKIVALPRQSKQHGQSERSQLDWIDLVERTQSILVKEPGITLRPLAKQLGVSTGTAKKALLTARDSNQVSEVG